MTPKRHKDGERARRWLQGAVLSDSCVKRPFLLRPRAIGVCSLRKKGRFPCSWRNIVSLATAPGALRNICGRAVLLAFLWAGLAPAGPALAGDAVLRIYDYRSGAVYAQAPVRVNSRLFFGWIHSLEQIPWNEYYHVDENYHLVLDAITFPAFGAGIPADKGRKCRIKDGLIHMEEIDQVFTELDWLNSHTATREIRLDGAHVTRGSELPHHTRLRLLIEKR